MWLNPAQKWAGFFFAKKFDVRFRLCFIDIMNNTPTLLSEPSKMPCVGFNLPALKFCPAAKILLAKAQEGIDKLICSSCYACKGFYQFTNTKNALQKKADFVLDSLRKDNGQTFVKAMSTAIFKKYYKKDGTRKTLKNINTKLFRVHDSGDLFNVAYIKAWKQICQIFPTIRFWFPTREWTRESQMEALKDLASLPNVSLKPSALEIDQPAPKIEGLDAGTAVYSTKEKAEEAGHYVCPATYVKGKDGKVLASCSAHNCNLCFIKGCKKPIAYLAH